VTHPGPRWRSWLLAIRPKTLSAGAAPVLIGSSIAWQDGVFAPAPAAAALLGALLIQIATNLANDLFDFRKGGDREDRIGPTRVVQAGLLTPEAVARATALTLLLATLVGGYLVWVGGTPILVIGLLSLLCAVAYTGGPFPLAYHGLGELFTLLFFGLIAVTGTYWVQGLRISPDALLAGAGVGVLSSAILVVNNLRDRETDARAGKRTMAVRIGERGSRIEFLLLLLLGAAVPPLGVALLAWSPWTLMGSLGLLPTLGSLRVVLTFRDPRSLNAVLGRVAGGTLLYALLLSAGFLLG